MYTFLLAIITFLLWVQTISAITVPSFPSIKDEIFPGFATGPDIPRIPLTFVHGVVSSLLHIYIYLSLNIY